jgi:hypothetical protein
MTMLGEKTRIYQATLEARRSAWLLTDEEEAETMNEAVSDARRVMEVAWLNASSCTS